MISQNSYKGVMVYLHRRATDNSVFYVGLGTKNRPWCTDGRNPYWVNTYEKYGLVVEIVDDLLTYDEAAELEIELIRKYSKQYQLTNMTKGGETPFNPLVKHPKIPFKGKTPKRRKKAKKQPQKASGIASVIIMMAEQYSIRQIAKKLSISPTTVRNVLQ